ncbi:MAG: histidinol-phosphate aminotransferase [Clostridiales bacterium]|nr:histidinol-phosphate aminotransferase [Clostridiales bacterium]
MAKKADPYTPGEQPRERKYIKLNTNENPYGPSPRAIAAIKEVADDSLRLYPDPTCEALTQTLAEYHGRKPEEVFVGNGSDEVLALAFMTFFNPGDPVAFPDITYSFYPVYANLFNIDYHLVPLEEDFSLSLDRFPEKNGGVIIPNPNAPTGKTVTLDFIETLLKRNPDKAVIIDEAYIDFGGTTAVNLVDTYPNLLVIYTLSKSRSLAGLRVGYAIGQAPLIEGLNRVKNSFNSYTLDRLAIAGAIEAIRDEAYFQETREKIITTREKTAAALRALQFTVHDSVANFIFISSPDMPAKQLFEGLRAEGVLVRYFNKPRIDNYLRVSIGTDDEMEAFVSAIRRIFTKEGLL